MLTAQPIRQLHHVKHSTASLMLVRGSVAPHRGRKLQSDSNLNFVQLGLFL